MPQIEPLTPDHQPSSAAPVIPRRASPAQRLRGLVTVALGLLGAGAGVALHVPAGAIVGSVLLVGTLSATTGRVPPLPNRLRRGAMVLSGTVIGSGAGPHLLESLATYLVPALFMVAWVILVGLVLGWWLSRRTGLDLGTALFCFAPGGLADMTVISAELGYDSRLVALVGLTRILITIVGVPLVLGYLVLR